MCSKDNNKLLDEIHRDSDLKDLYVELRALFLLYSFIEGKVEQYYKDEFCKNHDIYAILTSMQERSTNKTLDDFLLFRNNDFEELLLKTITQFDVDVSETFNARGFRRVIIEVAQNHMKYGGEGGFPLEDNLEFCLREFKLKISGKRLLSLPPTLSALKTVSTAP